MLNNPAPASVATDRDPFMHGSRGRPLWLVVDEAHVDDSAASRVLTQLSDRPAVRVYSTCASAAKSVVLEAPVDPYGYVPALLTSESEAVRVPIPAAASVRRRAELLASEHGGDPDRLERLLLFAGLSRTTSWIDGLVVDERVVLEPPLRRQLGAHVLTTPEAVALLGLVLRAHGDFTVSRDGNVTRFIGAERFYRAVAFQHLARLEDWSTAAVTRWHNGESRPLTLADGIATRLARAFRARDFLQVRLRAPDFRDVWHEILFFLDIVLVQVVGALDLAARLLHEAYAVPLPVQRVGWRRQQWLAELGAVAPGVAAAAQPQQKFRDVVDLVAELRNLIHDAPLSAELHHVHASPGITDWGEGLVSLQVDDTARAILAAAQRRGGLVAWGLSDRSETGAVTFDPGLYAEEALRASTAALDEVLTLADSERLAPGPHKDASMWLAEPRDRENAALLFGLRRGGLRQDLVTFA